MNFYVILQISFGIPEEEEYGNLFGRTVIVSTVNEKGEEDFNIMVSVSDEKGRIKFEELKGIKGKEKEEKKEIYTTRDEEGNLGFNEIYRENEKIRSAQHIDTYSYDVNEDLINNYKDFDINKSDVENVKEILNRSKEEMSKTKENTKEDKGREM